MFLLCQFIKSYKNELSQKRFYVSSIGAIQLWLTGLQNNNFGAKKNLSKDQLKGLEDAEGILQPYDLQYVPRIIWIKFISCHHDDLFADHFGIDKTYTLIAR